MFWCSPMEIWLWTTREWRSLKLAFSSIIRILIYTGTCTHCTERGCLLDLFDSWHCLFFIYSLLWVSCYLNVLQVIYHIHINEHYHIYHSEYWCKNDVQVTKQPASEEWIAEDPAVYILIAEKDRRLIRGLTRVEVRMRKRTNKSNAVMRTRTHESRERSRLWLLAH
jgi:hypothetical protein